MLLPHALFTRIRAVNQSEDADEINRIWSVLRWRLNMTSDDMGNTFREADPAIDGDRFNALMRIADNVANQPATPTGVKENQ